MLIHRDHLNYVMAHRIVGKAIRQLINNGSDYITLEILNEAAANLSYLRDHAKKFKLVTDPYQIVALRQGERNATIESVARMIDGF
ncbi:hypothetical protein B1F79_05395 [Coxiella-like endosymbiont of Rhipicephalus sanguineus]|uniref:hypothetical protein n=1 Tax=Coxiella-like endosymbiont of Rhipicephalus sanguineus TaxID=1955402 RepID=UPI0020422CF0|nr:hypothetical protein [Coxiella-like endosymbiont of Rhipicephalus sanguineus]MBT8506813.1 hypothetical protein [Coxiella-like endosymbiont of Rhipicephalus sanguineus]